MHLCLLFSTGAERNLSKRRHQWSTTMIRQETYHLRYLWWTISGPRMISADASLHTSCEVYTLLNETVSIAAKYIYFVCAPKARANFTSFWQKMIENARIRSNPKIRKRRIRQNLMTKSLTIFLLKVKFHKNWSVRSNQKCIYFFCAPKVRIPLLICFKG